MVGYQAVTKRIIDFIVALSALILLIPFFVVVSIWIKRDSEGPVFFKGERMGRDGRPFNILKLRTMDAGATKMEAGLTVAGDARITSAGAYLRRFKLDELPQLYNVLRGEMSLVGPRPEIRKYVAMFPADFKKILTIRPGITDLASIRFRNESEFLARHNDPEDEYVRHILPEKIKLAHEYLAHASLINDFAIIAKTLALIFKNPAAIREGL